MMGNCIKESLSTSTLMRVKVELKHVRREPGLVYSNKYGQYTMRDLFFHLLAYEGSLSLMLSEMHHSVCKN